MRILGRLFKKKKEEVEEKIALTNLEIICADDPEALEALESTMFLNPQKIDVSLKDAVSKAREFERKKDLLRAALWYRIAGGLAIYEGDVSKVKEYFSKYATLTKKNLKILEIPDKAVKKAQEYYKRFLVRKEKEI